MDKKIDILKDADNVKLFETRNLKDLLEQNLGLVHKIMKTHGIDQTRQNFEDIKQDGIIGLWNAINTWNPKKSKLSTHAHYSIRKAVQNSIARSYVISLGRHNNGTTCYQSFIDHKKSMEVLHLDALINDNAGKSRYQNINPISLRDALSYETELQELKDPLQKLIDKENTIIIKNVYKRVVDVYYKFLKDIEVEGDGYTEFEIFKCHGIQDEKCRNFVRRIWQVKYTKQNEWRSVFYYNTVYNIKKHIRKNIKLGDVIEF